MPGALTKQALFLTGSRSLGQVLNALAGILIVRALTQHDYGTYRQIFLLYATLYIIGDAAFSQSLYHFIPRQRDRARIFLGQALAAALALSAVWTAGLLALSPQVGSYFSNADLPRHLALLSAWLTLNLLAKVPEAAYITLERTRAIAANIVVFESLKFTLIVAALWQRMGIEGLLWALVAGSAMRLLALLWGVRGEIGFGGVGALRDQFAYSMSLWLPGLFNNAGIYAHQYIVGYFFAPAQYAIYAVACFQIPLMGVLGTSVGEVLLVRATQYREEGRENEILRVWQNACRKSFLVYLPVAIGLAVLAEPLIVTLFTVNYAASAPLFAVIVLTLPFQATFQDSLLRAFAAMRAYAFFYALRVALSIGLGVIGARWFGLMGAAVSVFCALLALNLCQLVYVARLLRAPFAQTMPWPELARIVGLSLVAAIPAAACAWGLRAWPMAALAAGLTSFGSMFLGLAWNSDLLRPEEKEALAGILGRFQKKKLRPRQQQKKKRMPETATGESDHFFRLERPAIRGRA